MKKLFGVMVLAGLPVACGSTIPSGPDAAQPVSSDENASAATLRNARKVPAPPAIPAPSPTPVPNCADVALLGINVSVVSNGNGFVTLRAEPVIASADPLVQCFAPVWTLSKKQSGNAYLETLKDPQEVTLFASTGQYEVTASSSTNSRKIVRGSTLVEIK